MQLLTYNSRSGRLEPRHSGRKMLARILLAHLRGLTSEEFADEELAGKEQIMTSNKRLPPDPASTDQIKREYRNGTIDYDRAIERLTRLGWTPTGAQEIMSARAGKEKDDN